LAVGLLALVLALNSRAAIPAPEQLLPADTLVMVTAPDFAKLRESYRTSPQKAFWNDEAMKPFRDKLSQKWQEELVGPIERNLGVKLDDYTGLLQGQLTLALTAGDSSDKDAQSPGLLLLLDAHDKSPQLKKNLAELRKKWIDTGKSLRTEKIRGLEFSILALSSNDVPKSLKKLFPPTPQVQDVPVEGESPKSPSKNEWVVGQFDSLLIVANSTRVAEKVLSRLTGGSMPSLAEQAAYEANRQALFRDAPLYGWANLKTIVESLTREAQKKLPQPDDPFVPFKTDKIVSACGLSGLKTFAFTFQNSSDGMLLQAFLGVPESSRQGLFKILPGEAKDITPPTFVPADAAKFQRWRVDGQKAWATLEKTLADISPQYVNTLNSVLDFANAAAKEKDPGFDVRKSLIGNLGDDVISYERAAQGNAPAPALYLIGSPNPEQLAAALKDIFLILNQQGTPSEREFLGRKIVSLPLPALPLPLPEASRSSSPRTLSYTASATYVALSTDTSLLEEYLRSGDSQAKALREKTGLREATQKVLGPGTGLFGYENLADTMRASFESLRKQSSSSPSEMPNPVTLMLASVGIGVDLKAWLDFSLLPPFEKVGKYFSFRVYAAGQTSDGMTFRSFSPTPPALKLEGLKQ